MKRALVLARKALGWTQPNPLVGAVLVKNNRCIGEGFHQRPGKPHAEIAALQNARETPLGATLYVTLEPCCHYGRTPPCTRAIIEAKIKRVVYAVDDPNPVVNGKGRSALLEAGIEVNSGVLKDLSQMMNLPYFFFLLHRRPLVTLKFAQSKDGFMGVTEKRIPISHSAARVITMKLRRESGALLVGHRTISVDDPLLTARDTPYAHQPLACILDPKLDSPPDAKVFGSNREVLVFHSSAASKDKRNRFQNPGIEFLEYPFEYEKSQVIAWILNILYTRQIHSLLVEGGLGVLSSFESAGVMDRLIRYVSRRDLEARTEETPVPAPKIGHKNNNLVLFRERNGEDQIQTFLRADLLSNPWPISKDVS